MPRYKLGARVTGPYYCEARKKWRLFVYDGPKTTVRWFDTEKAARKGLNRATKERKDSLWRGWLLGELVGEQGGAGGLQGVLGGCLQV